MRVALARHDGLFEEAVRSHGGVHIRPRGEGDSRFAVFTSAPDAVAAALTIQRAFASEPWPTPRPVRVRIGLHTGEAQLRDDDYYGSAVNRCARIRNLGHGGQILLSEATTVLVRDRMPNDTRVLDLGEQRLRDLTRPERIFQPVSDDLAQDFPPLATLDAGLHNLPVQPTALLGREHQVEEVRRQLLRDDVRLVTLTGAGGTGKTRLGLQVAAELMDAYRDGVFLVELAPITDPTLVPSAIAQVLGNRDIGSRPVIEGLKEHLRRRSILLLLDNFEQVIPAAPVVADLLAASTGLTVLVTSREPLHLRGEREYAVPSLSLPEAQHRPTASVLARSDAAALFVERAQAIRADFAVTAENAPVIADICSRLDGLPLAIELAAARVRLLSPEAMLARLERPLPLLTSGPQDLPARQRTLRDAIAWSYDLLTPAEQSLFRRLAIFVGGWALETAEAAATAEVGDPRWALAADDSLDGIDSLIAKNLVRRVSHPSGALRFTMFETIREYGLEQLGQNGELHALRRWHAVYFLELAERAVPRLRGAERGAWLDRLEAEHDNVRAALEWALVQEQAPELALRLSGAMAWFWASRGRISEGRRRLEQALAMPPPTPGVMLGALYGAGWLAHVGYDGPAARQLLQAALDLSRETDDRWATTWTLHLLGRVAYYEGDAISARELGRQSLQVARALPDDWLIAWALHLLGLAAHITDDFATARRHYEEVLTIRRRLGFQEGIGMCAFLLGLVAYRLGDYAESHALTREGLMVFHGLGAKWTVQNALGASACLAALAQPRLAVRLAGATQAHGDAVAVPPIPLVQGILRPSLARLRIELGEAEFLEAWAEGQALSIDEAVADALAVETPPAGHQSAQPAAPAGLSARELSVLRLIAAGRTNREIADELSVSVPTVERHITHLYGKIDARGRADATAFALKHGLA
jgi:predicted ATPase/DNA-binding CsgD family transcriptional regulator